jgi:hypothetical protein
VTGPGVSTRIQGAVSAAWGVALLARGHRWWIASTGREPTATERAAIVVLACRQLIEGLAQTGAPHRLRRTWLVVDLAHAGSMALLARQHPSLRRPALLSAGIATLSGAASLWSLRAQR